MKSKTVVTFLLGLMVLLLAGVLASTSQARSSLEDVQQAQDEVADLWITKSDSADPMWASNFVFNYLLTLGNNGPSTAQNVVVVDDLPPGMRAVSVPDGCALTGSTDWEFQKWVGNETVTCNLGTLEVDAVRELVIDVAIDPAMEAGALLFNKAEISSDNPDEDTSNNIAGERTLADARANLGVLNLDTNDPAVAGGLVSYIVGIGNLYPSSVARDVRVFHILPEGVTYHSDTLTGPGGCEVSPIEWTFQNLPLVPAGALRCDLGDMDQGELDEYSITLRIDPDVPAGTVLMHRAIIFAFGTPVDVGYWNNIFDAETIVLTEADLEVTKMSEPAQVYAGQQVKYTAEVRNNGPSDAQNVVLTDVLPSELAYESDSAVCQVNGQNVACDLGTITAGQTLEVDIWATVKASAAPGVDIYNEACAVSQAPATPDPNPNNNCGGVESVTKSSANLKVLKFGKMDGEVRAGEELTYTIIVDNLGPGDAHDVELRDVLQSSGQFTVVSIESNRANYTCSPGAGTLPQTFNQRLELNCSLNEPLEVLRPGSSGRWMLTMVVTANDKQDINNIAYVDSSSEDADTSNNQAIVEHAITDLADLNFSKCVKRDDEQYHYCGDNPYEIVAGEPLTFYLYVTNNGPSAAEKIVVVDTLPRGATLISINHPGDNWDCNVTQPAAGDTVLTCGYPNAPAGVLQRISYRAMIAPETPQDATLINGGYVTSGVFDNVSSNDFDEILLKTNAHAQLTVTKDGSPDSVMAGDSVEYAIVAGNKGPSSARGIWISDNLPDAVGFTSVQVLNRTDGICTYSAVRHAVNCSFDQLDPNQQIKLQIDGYIKRDTLDLSTVNNHVQVTSQSGASATSKAQTSVTGAIDLHIEETGNPLKVYAGDELKYTVKVENRGPSNAYDVVIRDELPANVAYQIDSGNCLLVRENPDVLECSIDSLWAGQTYELEIWSRVDKATPDGTTLTNKACAEGTTRSGAGADQACATGRNLVMGEPDLSVNMSSVGFTLADNGAETEETNAVTAGKALRYVLEVGNNSTAVAENVLVENELPAGIEVAGIEVSDDAGRCNPGTPGDPTRPMTCNLGDMPAESSVTVTVHAKVASSVPGESRLFSNAAASCQFIGGSNADDFDTNWTAVNARVDLSLSKTLEQGATAVGQEVRYVITAENSGPSDAPQAKVEDIMPVTLANVSWQCQATNGATCPALSGSGNISELVDLPNGGKLVYRITGTLQTTGSTMNTATVSVPVSVLDINEGNNTDQAGTSMIYMPGVMNR